MPRDRCFIPQPSRCHLIVSDEKIKTNIPFQTMSYDLALGNSNVILYHLIKMTPIDMSIKKKKNLIVLLFCWVLKTHVLCLSLYLKMSLASIRDLFTESATVKKEHFLYWGVEAQVERGGQLLEMRLADMWGPGWAESLSHPWNNFPTDCPQVKMQTCEGKSSLFQGKEKKLGFHVESPVLKYCPWLYHL